jgi:uncharacterized membrane protein
MKNLFKNQLLQSVLILLGILFIFQYAIAPGLTAASSITNIITVLFSVFIVFGLFGYLKSLKTGEIVDEDELKEAHQSLKVKSKRKTKTK